MQLKSGNIYRFLRTGFLLLVCNVLFATAALAMTDVKAIRLGVNNGKTRFVMELATKPVYTIFYLANPDRIVIDMQEVNWTTAKTGKKSVGLINNYRYGLFRQGTSRIVLDLKKPVKILSEVILPPAKKQGYRFFIDIVQTDKDAFIKTVKESRKRKIALLPPIPRQRIKPDQNQKPTIIIDAGHGGIDPGATGRSGVFEKKLTLRVAQRLKEYLQKSNKYNVIMTRDKDIFLSLRERVNVARKYKGDLFISLHADSIGRPDISGSTVYTLSENASDDEAAALAREHDKSDVIAGVDLEEQDDTVQGILIDLAQRETMNFSVKFAQILLPEIAASGMKTNGRSHRFAGFRVLKAPDVPSVLVELGYLSNRHDEKIMRSKSGQRKLARSVSRAIDKYFKNLQSR